MSFPDTAIPEQPSDAWWSKIGGKTNVPKRDLEPNKNMSKMTAKRVVREADIFFEEVGTVPVVVIL